MSTTPYTFFATLESPEGELISDERLEVDWHPALEWARFDSRVRRMGVLHPPAPAPAIEPVWSALGSAPYVRGFTIRETDNETDSVQFPLTYFSSAVSAASKRLVESGALKAGQRFDYRVYALPDHSSRTVADSSCEIIPDDTFPAIEVNDTESLVAGAEKHLSPFVHEGNATQSTGTQSTPPILIPRRVLTEASALARQAAEVETGGVLVGKLCRDENGWICYRITAQIPAEHTHATRETLRFTPETWVSVDAAIRLRDLGETAMGWWHSHPWFCRQCPPERRSLCAFSKPVFSQADRAVHREVFVKPWNVALLLSFLGEQEPNYDVFAWKHGQIEAADFYVLPDDLKQEETNARGK